MGELLRANPMLVLILVIGLGYLLGKIRIGGFQLGVAGVLFAGLAASAWDSQLALPAIIYEFGLIIFVYSVGLSAGPGFVNTLRRRGWRENVLIAVILAVTGGLAVAGALGFGIDGRTAAGMFAGAFTNTPALAGVVEALDGDSTPVIGYSLTYPMGVLGVIAVISVLERAFRVRREAAPADHSAVRAWTIRVTREDRPTVKAILQYGECRVQVSRVRLGGQIHLAQPSDELAPGALVTVVGDPGALQRVADWLGERVEADHLPFDARQIDSRPVLVSNPAVVHRPLAALGLLVHNQVIITRVRRGETDIVPGGDTELELGDRIRIVGPVERLDDAARLFGDSYTRAAEVNILSFAIGIGLGLLLGLVPFPLPGGGEFRLGAAGGTLLVALVLGARGRTGPVVWQLPHGVATTLSQLGVVLFLAGIGTRAGANLRAALADAASLRVIGVGAVLTMLGALLVLVAGHRLLKIPFDRLTGIAAGMQTQPAVLAFAGERYAGEATNLGYASVYPMAMILKILIAQAVLHLT